MPGTPDHIAKRPRLKNQAQIDRALRTATAVFLERQQNRRQDALLPTTQALSEQSVGCGSGSGETSHLRHRDGAGSNRASKSGEGPPASVGGWSSRVVAYEFGLDGLGGTPYQVDTSRQCDCEVVAYLSNEAWRGPCSCGRCDAVGLRFNHIYINKNLLLPPPPPAAAELKTMVPPRQQAQF